MTGPGLAAALALGALAVGWAPVSTWAPEPPWAVPRGELASQSLYRLRYEGPRGSASQRVVMRLVSEDRFRLQGSDPFGRTRWSLESRGPEVLFQDHTAGAYCRAGAGFTLPEPGLETVAVASLPRVLLGRIPADPVGAVDPAPGRLDFRDRHGDRWTARLREEGPAAWTLWRTGEPRLWWTGSEAEGVLSSRRGVQLRWRRTAREPLAAGAVDAPMPAPDFVEVDCAAFYPVDGAVEGG